MSNFFPVYTACFIVMSLRTCFSSYDSTIGPNTMPREMDSMAIGYDSSNDTILLFGGYSFTQQFTIFKDNQFTDRGEGYLSSSQTTFSYSQHYTTLDDRLWIINENGKNLLWIDLQTYSATTASFTLPIDVNEYGCLTSHQTYLIVLGGYGGGDLNTVQIYDLSNNEWLSDIPTLLKKRTMFACLTVNNNTYAIGGWDGYNDLSSIEVLDVSNIAQINTQQWQYLSGALYEPTRAIRAVQYGDYIITIGGQGTDDTRLTDINLIDTVTGNCNKVSDLAFGTSYAASIVVHNILYIFGGWTASGPDDRYQIIYLPTATPTKNPTHLPVMEPTETPSFEPTFVPTLSPTQLPSEAPTKLPTLLPTVNPSKPPSYIQSYYPSSDPTTDTVDLTSFANVSSTQIQILATTNTPQTLPISSQTSSLYPSNSITQRNAKPYTILKAVLALLTVLIISISVIICVLCWKWKLMRNVSEVVKHQMNKANHDRREQDIALDKDNERNSSKNRREGSHKIYKENVQFEGTGLDNRRFVDSDGNVQTIVEDGDGMVCIGDDEFIIKGDEEVTQK